MMCDECGVRPANIHLTTFVNGEKQEKNLCAACMTKYKKQLPGIDFSNLAGLLGSFMDKTLSGSSYHEKDTFDAVCPNCATTYHEFKRSGMLGCSECYKAFREPLEELLVRVHGNAQHSGRVPGGVDSKVAMRLNIDRLKQKLVNAIAEEEYEQAAQLRDQIRMLQGQMENKQVSCGEAKND